MEDIIKKKYENEELKIFPTHEMNKFWQFNEHEEAEALLAQAMAMVGKKNKINANDLQHLFPAVLRMLKSNSDWSK